MCELAVADAGVSALMAQERVQAAASDFADVGSTSAAEGADAPTDGETQPSMDWVAQLTVNKQTGVIKATIDNVWLILENDPNLKGKFALNEFAGRGEVLGALPWEKRSKRRLWDDNDNQGLYWYMEKYYNITGNGKIDGALSLHSVNTVSTRCATT